MLLKLVILTTSFWLSTNLYAGIGEYYFKKSGISCLTNGVQLSDSIKGSTEQLINCYSANGIPKSSLESFEKDSQNLRQDLELWLYLQNAITKLKNQADQNYTRNQNYAQRLKKKVISNELNQIKEKYELLYTLYQNRKKLENELKLCSNWRIWNLPKRLMNSKLDCQSVKTFNQDYLNEINSEIDNHETLYPQFVHPYLQKKLKSDNKEDFTIVYQNYIEETKLQLDDKRKYFRELSKLELSKENLDELLKNKQLIISINAINYKPDSHFIGNTGDKKIVSLNTAHCHIAQTQNANEIDQILKEFATDVALLMTPFSIKGKINALYKITKAAKAASNAKKARGAFVLAEGAYIAVENNKLNEAQNQCEELQKTASHQVKISKNLQKKLKDCFDLIDSLTTSRTLALLGGMAGAKLSKLDITDLRKARIIAKGKDKLRANMSTVKATLIKQSDLILDTLESMTPQPQMAMAGIDSTNQFNKSAQDSVSSGNISKKNKKKKKGHAHLDADQIKDIERRVDIHISKLDCFIDKSCKTEMLHLTPGIKKLAIGPKGLFLAEEVINLFQGAGFKNLEPEFQALLRECLKVKNKVPHCNHNQFEAIFALMDHPFQAKPHPYYYEQILESIKFDASGENFSRSVYYLSEVSPQSKPQKVSGRLGEAQYIGNDLYIDGEIAIEYSDRVKAVSLIREEKAAHLLARMGYKVNLLEDKIEKRKEDGTQKLFMKLRELEKIKKNRNPDLILNNNYIADIYSPLYGLKEESVEVIKNGILTKSEDTNFKKESINDFHDTDTGKKVKNVYGKRQTNRVIVYIDQVNGDKEKISQQIRESIAAEKPKYLKEAFILIDNGEAAPERLPVWP